MNVHTVMTLILTVGGIAAVVWVLNKIGRALTAVIEALATLAVVFLGLWLLIKTTFLFVRWTIVHWRTTLGVTAVAVLPWWLGWLPVAIITAALAAGLVVWRWRHRTSFEVWVGRRLRSWWLRWTVYAPRLPKWLRACGLTVQDADRPIVLTANPLGRNKIRRQPKPRANQVPRVLGVRSGPSWDEVRVRLVPGQKPEDFDEAARALAVARGVERCQVRELKPKVQRRNLLADTVACHALAELADVPGSEIDVRRVWSGRTEYGTDWHQSLQGSHTLHAGATGAGKGAQMWCPLVSIAPAIRDGLVRVSGIDPKGMERLGRILRRCVDGMRSTPTVPRPASAAPAVATPGPRTAWPALSPFAWSPTLIPCSFAEQVPRSGRVQLTVRVDLGSELGRLPRQLPAELRQQPLSIGKRRELNRQVHRIQVDHQRRHLRSHPHERRRCVFTR
jgi:DNA segregation ATPase FtsK/SpoIIIE, S-DNA-T family